MSGMESACDILLVDDNPADTDLTAEVLARNGCRGRIHTVCDGVEAIAFLRGQGKYSGEPAPHLVLLDLNMPRKDGRAVLTEVKSDPVLRKIPVIVFTTSQSPRDVTRSYELGANCYVNKPGNLPEFVAAVTEFGNFWFRRAYLPPRNHEAAR
jgi:two-component system, chemotaxis family, response regulator Rcp1